MGIVDFLKGELLEIIVWTNDSRDTLSYRFPDDDKEIKNGARLIVRESQQVQFVAAGKYADLFNPGKHTLSTEKIPILSTIMGWKYVSTLRSNATCITSTRVCSPAINGALPIR